MTLGASIITSHSGSALCLPFGLFMNYCFNHVLKQTNGLVLKIQYQYLYNSPVLNSAFNFAVAKTGLSAVEIIVFHIWFFMLFMCFQTMQRMGVI